MKLKRPLSHLQLLLLSFARSAPRLWNGPLGPVSSHPRVPMLLSLLFGLSLGVSLLTLGSPAHAQRAFYLDRVQFGGAPEDGMVTRRAFLREGTRFYGSTALGYTLNPLRASTVAASPSVEERIENPVEHQLISYFSGGVEFMGRAAVSVTLPVAWMQLTGDVPAEGARPPLPIIFPPDSGVAMYDVSLGGRLRLLGEKDDSFRLGLGGALFIPSGTFTKAASDDAVTYYLYAAVEEELGPLLVAGTVGPHFRPLRGIAGTDSALDVGSEIRINAAAFLDLHTRLRVGAELNGMIGFEKNEAASSNFFDGPASPWEWLGSGRLLLGSELKTYVRAAAGTRFTNGYGAPDLRVLVSVGHWTLFDDIAPEDTTRVRFEGDPVRREKPPPDRDTDSDGFPDSIDACVDQAEDGEEPNPGDGCPVTSDRDGDGIVDIEDSCPSEPEDRDQIQDEDGCPETDADQDGVQDARDACPLVQGVEHGDPNRDGCPMRKKKTLIVEEEGELKLLSPVEFETATAVLREVSFALLDEVVEVMVERPEVRIAVHGHTDNRGSAAYNQRLSKQRADAVVKYLIDKGIELERLESEGFGPVKPIATNDTPEGRAKNRRVEFKIIAPEND